MNLFFVGCFNEWFIKLNEFRCRFHEMYWVYMCAIFTMMAISPEFACWKKKNWMRLVSKTIKPDLTGKSISISCLVFSWICFRHARFVVIATVFGPPTDGFFSVRAYIQDLDDFSTCAKSARMMILNWVEKSTEMSGAYETMLVQDVVAESCVVGIFVESSCLNCIEDFFLLIWYTH